MTSSEYFDFLRSRQYYKTFNLPFWNMYCKYNSIVEKRIKIREMIPEDGLLFAFLPFSGIIPFLKLIGSSYMGQSILPLKL